MSMLADPRQRKRYMLVPRGKPLYEDENRFGTKMLEKMGWQKGKGLGASEDGQKDFVRVRYKKDVLGLGFKQRDDQWTEHEQSFNDILNTLNNKKEDIGSNMKEENSDEYEDDMPRIGFGFKGNNMKNKSKPKVEKLKEKISGVSLEEKSKQSKARVHYKKFTKGKDLAQYSEKDLASIFGKKAADEQQAVNDFYNQLNETSETKLEETKDEEHIEGGQMINTGVSVNDYFKTKMDALKKRKNGYVSMVSDQEKETTSNEVRVEENGTKKKKKKKKKDQDMEGENINEMKDNSEQLIYSEVSEIDNFKLEIETIMNKQNNVNTVENETIYNEVQEKVIAKKKKNYKQTSNQKNVSELKNNVDNKEKKNSKNNAINSFTETEKQNEMDDVDTNTKKGKKFKKRGAVENTEVFQVEETKIKKKGKTKTKSQEESETIKNTEVFLEEETKTKKKKDKTKKNQEDLELLNDQVNNSDENLAAKKRKHENSPANKTPSKSPTDLTQEPVKKKQKRNQTKESNDKETEAIAENELRNKKKSKKSKESNEISEKHKRPFIPNQTDERASEQPSTKAKLEDVSFNSKNVFISDVNTQILDLDELKKKYNAFNMYTISSFCAEKFRNICLNNFEGSILPQIVGYGLDANIQLDVTINPNDEERITNLWKCVLNKYSGKPLNTYQRYVRETVKAYKTKQKCPKLYVKPWKRKNIFQII